MTDQTGADDALKSSKAHSTKAFSESGKLCPAVAMVSRIPLSAEKRLLSPGGRGVSSPQTTGTLQTEQNKTKQQISQNIKSDIPSYK